MSRYDLPCVRAPRETHYHLAFKKLIKFWSFLLLIHCYNYDFFSSTLYQRWNISCVLSVLGGASHLLKFVSLLDGCVTTALLEAKFLKIQFIVRLSDFLFATMKETLSCCFLHLRQRGTASILTVHVTERLHRWHHWSWPVLLSLYGPRESCVPVLSDSGGQHWGVFMVSVMNDLVANVDGTSACFSGPPRQHHWGGYLSPILAKGFS